jgi:DNA-nicking Smr family endonuclease
LPALRDFPAEGLVEVDLHGYSVLTAARVAREKVREAHARGYRVVRLITGRSTTRRPGGYPLPTIRAEVREMLERGDFARWAYPFASGRHVHGAGHLSLQLRPNRRPHPAQPWSPLPPAEYRAADR